jgi:hypothetical protein
MKLCEGTNDIEKEMKRGSEVILTKGFSIREDKRRQGSTYPMLFKLPQEFEELFEEPSALPPKRMVDHSISLLPNTKSVNFRPYRYSYFQR